MPRRDGSGPWGMGPPMTGRGFGPPAAGGVTVAVTDMEAAGGAAV